MDGSIQCSTLTQREQRQDDMTTMEAADIEQCKANSTPMELKALMMNSSFLFNSVQLTPSNSTIKYIPFLGLIECPR